MIKQSQEDLSARPFVFEKLISSFYILFCKFFYNINVLLLLILNFYNFLFGESQIIFIYHSTPAYYTYQEHNFSISFSKTKGHARTSFCDWFIIDLKHRIHIQPTHLRFRSCCHLLVSWAEDLLDESKDIKFLETADESTKFRNKPIAYSYGNIFSIKVYHLEAL